MDRQEAGDEVRSMEMEINRLSATTVPVTVQGGHEERRTAKSTSRPRGAEMSRIAATRRRKRPISSLYHLDGWVNKTRGIGGGRGTVRESQKPAEGSRTCRNICVATSSHRAKGRHRNITSDPKRASDDR